MELIKIGAIALFAILLLFVLKDHAGSKTGSAKARASSKSGGGGGSSGTCSASCGAPGSGTKLLPILDPLYNMREICKQCILLEDHLFQKRKRCEDCITKHMLTIEALAEEAVTLDKEHKCVELYELPDQIRAIEKYYEDNGDPNGTAQKFRAIRKSLMLKCKDHF